MPKVRRSQLLVVILALCLLGQTGCRSTPSLSGLYMSTLIQRGESAP